MRLRIAIELLATACFASPALAAPDSTSQPALSNEKGVVDLTVSAKGSFETKYVGVAVDPVGHANEIPRKRMSDAGGRLRLELKSGEYMAKVRPDRRQPFAGSVTFSVVAGSTTRPVLEVTQAASAKGAVEYTTGEKAPKVQISCMETDVEGSWREIDTVESTSDGQFLFPVLPADGRYRFFVDDPRYERSEVEVEVPTEQPIALTAFPRKSAR